MKVKIIKCSLPTFWYVDNIGETFEVEFIDNEYEVIQDPDYPMCADENLFIEPTDIEIIEQ